MGLSADRSWDLTPREFRALELVYERGLNRWGQERAHFFNAHFKHPVEGARYWPDDFVDTTWTRTLRDERTLMLAITAAAAHQTRLMKEGKFDESLLPSWARMTEQEKRDRGIVQ